MPESNIPSNKPLEHMLQVEVVNHTTRDVHESELADAVRAVLREHRILRAAISLAVVDDPTIHRLNREHLGHDYETDVLTFPSSNPSESGSLDGEIIASVDMAERVSREIGLDPRGELLLYAIHGTLHLIGLDDADEGSAKQMRQAERRFLQSFGYPYHFPEDDANHASYDD